MTHSISFTHSYCVPVSLTLLLPLRHRFQTQPQRHEVAGWLRISGELSIYMRSVRFRFHSKSARNSPYLFHIVFPSMWFFDFENIYRWWHCVYACISVFDCLCLCNIHRMYMNSSQTQLTLTLIHKRAHIHHPNAMQANTINCRTVFPPPIYIYIYTSECVHNTKRTAAQIDITNMANIL